MHDATRSQCRITNCAVVQYGRQHGNPTRGNIIQTQTQEVILSITAGAGNIEAIAHNSQKINAFAEGGSLRILLRYRPTTIKILRATFHSQKISVYLQPLLGLHHGPQKLPRTQTTWPLRRSRSFKVTHFGTNRITHIGDFLLVINTNFAPFQSYGRLLVKFFLAIGSASLSL